jgi:hypothetical protein
MFKVTILICALATPGAECERATALDVIRGARVDTPQQCGFAAQAQLAPTRVAPEPGRQYAKILCDREKPTGAP